MKKILIIEDETSIRNVLKNILIEEDPTYEILEAENGQVGLKKIEELVFDLILCDIKMPRIDGVELLKKIKEIQPEIPVIMISGHGDVNTAVECMKIGAYDFISKPPDLHQLLLSIHRALDRNKLKQENKVLKRKISSSKTMIGESKAMTAIRSMIDRVCQTDARVLVTGPNGSGKELVAYWIHQNSQRSQIPMVEVNCAAIPSELIESELFGHEKGAFTSANTQHKGKFELAHQGTLFLDEIGDMSLSAQAKVLRVLEEKKITRVGGSKTIAVDVRVIAATNKNLKKEIANGKFREDLYHRLAIIPISVPALRDRVEDIPLLIDHFIKVLCKEMKISKKKIQPKAIELLQKKDWPGNIREVKNVMERLIILGEGDQISQKDVVSFT